MTLNGKIATAIATMTLVLGTVLFLAFSTFQLRAYAQVEEQAMQQALRRLSHAVAERTAELDGKVLDWTHWDDLQRFMADGDPEFAREYLNAAGLQTLRVDFMLFADSSGQVVSAIPDPAWAAVLAEHPRLFTFSDLQAVTLGLVQGPEGVALVAARPVLSTAGAGPSPGAMVAGRYLDAAALAELGGTTELPLAGFAPGDPLVAAELAAARTQLTAAQPVVVTTVLPASANGAAASIKAPTGAVVAGYMLLTDVDGAPVLVLRTEQPRTIYRQGELGLERVLGALLVGGLVLVLMIQLLLRRLVLQPISRLRAGVERVAAGELDCFLPVSQHDELGELAQAFNMMAQRLQARDQELAAAWSSLAATNASLVTANASLAALKVEQEARSAARTAELEVEVQARAQAQEALQRYAGQLERSNRDLLAFAYVASHDLQEPLRKIRTFGERLETRYGEVLGATGRDYVQRMETSAARMQNLIDGLLLLSRITTKGQPFVLVDLRQVVVEVLADLETRVAAVGAIVEVGPLATVEADPLQMRQLVQNLISNALKFTRPDVAPHIRVSGEYVAPASLRQAGGNEDRAPAAGPRFALWVEDNGIGFEEIYRERIFNVFQRLHGNGEYAGAGIGLAICRRIAERHGGTIRAFGRPGEGASFVVNLPLRQDEAEATRNPATDLAADLAANLAANRTVDQIAGQPTAQKAEQTMIATTEQVLGATQGRRPGHECAI